MAVAVTDDETAGVSILPEELTIAEGGSDSYRGGLDVATRPRRDRHHHPQRGRGHQHRDQELTFTDSDWNQAQTVAVTAAQDDDARDDTAALSHTVASTDGDYNGITVSEVAVTVTDDEMAGVSILPEELTIAEGGSDEVVLTYQVVHDGGIATRLPRTSAAHDDVTIQPHRDSTGDRGFGGITVTDDETAGAR